ncbi:hypothetical protein MMPV_007508 [Pyropia vietnamensis]
MIGHVHAHPSPPPATLGALAGLLPLTPFTLVLFVAAWSVDAAAAARVTFPAVTATLRAAGYSPSFLATTPVTVTVGDLYADDTAAAAAAAADAAARAAHGRGRLGLFPAARRRHAGAATAAVGALRSVPLLPALVLMGAPPPGGDGGGGWTAEPLPLGTSPTAVADAAVAALRKHPAAAVHVASRRGDGLGGGGDVGGGGGVGVGGCVGALPAPAPPALLPPPPTLRPSAVGAPVGGRRPWRWPGSPATAGWPSGVYASLPGGGAGVAALDRIAVTSTAAADSSVSGGAAAPGGPGDDGGVVGMPPAPSVVLTLPPVGASGGRDALLAAFSRAAVALPQATFVVDPAGAAADRDGGRWGCALAGRAPPPPPSLPIFGIRSGSSVGIAYGGNASDAEALVAWARSTLLRPSRRLAEVSPATYTASLWGGGKGGADDLGVRDPRTGVSWPPPGGPGGGPAAVLLLDTRAGVDGESAGVAAVLAAAGEAATAAAAAKRAAAAAGSSAASADDGAGEAPPPRGGAGGGPPPPAPVLWGWVDAARYARWVERLAAADAPPPAPPSTSPYRLGAAGACAVRPAAAASPCHCAGVAGLARRCRARRGSVLLWRRGADAATAATAGGARRVAVGGVPPAADAAVEGGRPTYRRSGKGLAAVGRRW